MEYDSEPTMDMSTYVNEWLEPEPTLDEMRNWFYNDYLITRRDTEHTTSSSTEYDIIVAIYLHGVTNACPTKYKPNFANATLMEAVPCGVGDFCIPARSNLTIQTAIERFRKDPLFIHKLQEELTNERNTHISIFNEEKVIPPKFMKAFELFSGTKPWRIIEKGYMEREYTSDKNLNKIIVHYASRGPFKLNQNLYEIFRVSTRSELMALLQKAGYQKPLLLDSSCGVFKEGLFDESTHASKRELQETLGVGGRKTRYKKRRRRSVKNAFRKCRSRGYEATISSLSFYKKKT